MAFERKQDGNQVRTQSSLQHILIHTNNQTGISAISALNKINQDMNTHDVRTTEYIT